jgi:hypothetical protein
MINKGSITVLSKGDNLLAQSRYRLYCNANGCLYLLEVYGHFGIGRIMADR